MAGQDELVGKTGPQIAAMVIRGEISAKVAEDFVASRARKRLKKSVEQLQSLQPQQA